jgi:DNA-binding transcriptional ArsR family regulator
MLNHFAPLDLAFQALADPARRAMLERLSAGPASVSELARPLSMSMPAVLQHLAVLEQAGLARSRKQGRVRTCELGAERLAEVQGWLDARRAEWEARFDRLAAYLDATKEEE